MRLTHRQCLTAILPGLMECVMQMDSMGSRLAPHAPGWFLLRRPGWFQADSPERLSEESDAIVFADADLADSIPHVQFAAIEEPERHPPPASPTERSARPDRIREKETGSLPAERSRRPDSKHLRQEPKTWSVGGLRVRDALTGAAAASFVFLVFLTGFLSRGFVEEDSRPVVAHLPAQPDQPADQRTAQPDVDPLPPADLKRPVAASRQPHSAEARTVIETAVPETPMKRPVVETTTVAVRSQPAEENPGPSPWDSVPRVLAKTKTDPSNPPASWASVLPGSQKPQTGFPHLTPDQATLDVAQCTAPAEGTLGTAIAWADSPKAAWAKARQTGQPVMLMHVSGNFEKPGFT